MEELNSQLSHHSDENVEIEETYFQDIDTLLTCGVNEDDVNKLKNNGINTMKGFEMTTREKLLQIEGFTESKVNKIKETCLKLTSSNELVTALAVSNQREQVFRVSTGSKQLDQLLGGGIESMSITQAFGESRSGKTQLSHTLCVTAQMPNGNGYNGGKVIFIDTEHTFRPERLKKIAERFNLVSTEVLENVLCARAYTSEHQYDLLNKVAAKLHEEAGVFKLLIVDSIIALFRVDFSGPTQITTRQQKLAQMMSRLKKISEEYNIAVFVTNQISSDMSGNTLLQHFIPVGGNILAHSSTTRVSLERSPGGKRIAKIYDSPELAESEAPFAITSGGIDDAED